MKEITELADDDYWTFIVKVEDRYGYTFCTTIDLKMEEHRGDVDVFRGADGVLVCQIGNEDDGVPNYMRIVEAFSLGCTFVDKFDLHRRISVCEFARRYCDSLVFDGMSDAEVNGLKVKLDI